jgi:hypothetical protein
VVVAATLDDSTERIIAYLTERGIPINALLFQVFAYGAEQLISRAWLIDPIRAQVSSATTPGDPSEPWNGEFYSSFGHGQSRSWEDAVEHGFICAGGGSWYSRTLRLLGPGDRVWVRVPGSGLVDVGRATGRVQSAADFVVTMPAGDAPVLEVAGRANYHRESVDDPERSEYFVPVRWLRTVPLEGAVDEGGLFGSQSPVRKPTTPGWRTTVERLKARFPGFDSDGPRQASA